MDGLPEYKVEVAGDQWMASFKLCAGAVSAITLERHLMGFDAYGGNFTNLRDSMAIEVVADPKEAGRAYFQELSQKLYAKGWVDSKRRQTLRYKAKYNEWVDSNSSSPDYHKPITEWTDPEMLLVNGNKQRVLKYKTSRTTMGDESRTYDTVFTLMTYNDTPCTNGL